MVIFEKSALKGFSLREIKQKILEDGFNPIVITNTPGFIYNPHSHPETKLLVFLKGSMEVKAGGKKFLCGVGDKLIIPGNMIHSAIVGATGCEFFWSEKILV